MPCPYSRRLLNIYIIHAQRCQCVNSKRLNNPPFGLYPLVTVSWISMTLFQKLIHSMDVYIPPVSDIICSLSFSVRLTS